ncbi:MAG: PEP-CTERM sorting domain-containing protein [Phycisphaeraceae bacterium]|nr:PEP-CTERM sorting domain-containing protein [Phycisphaeraceae bacterium]
MYRISGSIAMAMAFALATGAARGDLVAHYEFNESAGPTLADSGAAPADDGTTNNLTFAASTAGVNGTGFGNAGVFDGTTSNVGFGTGAHPASFDLGTADFTISGWLKTPTNFQNFNRPLFGNIDDYTLGGWNIELGRADRTYRGKPFFTVAGGSSSVFSQTQLFSDVRLDDDTWHWVAYICSSGSLSMYVDGVKQLDTGTLVVGTSTATSPATVEARFGGIDFAARIWKPYEGQLDDWRIYNEALTGTLDGGTSGTLTSGALFDVWQANSASLQPGDANGDGMVNLSDLQILGDNWQSTTATWAEADFTGDGTVNLADLQILGDNWGFGTGPDVSFDEALAGVVIPEPAALALLLIPGAGVLTLRRRINN